MTLRSHAAISLDGDEFEFPRLKSNAFLMFVNYGQLKLIDNTKNNLFGSK